MVLLGLVPSQTPHSHPLLAPSPLLSSFLKSCHVRNKISAQAGQRRMNYFPLGSAFSFSLKKLRPGKKPTMSCCTLVLTSPGLAAHSLLDFCSSHQHSHWLRCQTLGSENTACAALTTLRKTWPKTEHYQRPALLGKACQAGAAMERGSPEGHGVDCVIRVVPSHRR